MLFTSYDNKQICVHEWKEVREPVGVVQIAHGMNEYAGRYEKFARRLNEIGYVVVADDHRGHGETDADNLGYAEGDMFTDTLKDMAGIARHYRGQYAGLKYVLFGFSYGSFLTQAFVQRQYNRFLDGAIIAGSSRQNALAVRFGGLVAGLGGAVKGEKAPARFVHSTVFGGYDKKFSDREFLSTSAENNARYHADPYCNFVCSNNFFSSFFKGLRGLYTREASKGLDRDLPLLLLSGADDAVGGAKGVDRLYDYYKKHGVRDVKKVLIAGSRHEFLNEEEHFEEAFGAVAAFLRGVQVRS